MVAAVLDELTKTYALVSPSDLEAVESLAARVPDLERENATLRAVCGRQGEALQTAYDVIRHRVCGQTECDDCLTGKATRMFSPRCIYRHAVKAANVALSLTPASVAESVANERIGRAADSVTQRLLKAVPLPETAYDRGYRAAIADVAREIAKAREGKPNGN
jgi:hypothetical protein